jgi:hypothetical protein
MSENTIIVQTKYVSTSDVFYFVLIICSKIAKVYSVQLTAGFSSGIYLYSSVLDGQFTQLCM